MKSYTKRVVTYSLLIILAIIGVQFLKKGFNVKAQALCYTQSTSPDPSCHTGTSCRDVSGGTLETACGGCQCTTFFCPNQTCGGGSCFPAGTKVTLSNNSTKNIEDIKAGDRVLSQDEAGKQSISTVQNLLKPVSNNMCEIKYTNGDSLKVTNSHPLFTQNGWKAIDPDASMKEDPGVPVTRLLVGDFMTKPDGSWPQISSISCKAETVQTYNLQVDNAHTYFAGGFLAHNKGCIYGKTCNTSCSKSCPGGDQGAFCGYTRTRPQQPKYECTTCTCNPPPSCTATAPTNVTFTRLSATSARISWTPGSNGTSQRLYVGANKVEVEANCPGTGSPACAVIENNLGASQTSYTTANVLVPGTSYYVRVVTYQSSSCSAGSATGRYLSSCSLSPSALTMTTGDSANVSATVYSSSEIQRVDFTSADPSSVSVAPASDTNYVYQTTATANKAGTTTITGDVYFTGPTLACTATTTVNAIPPGPWWQVKDSDITSMGDLTSAVPSGGFLFDLAGGGGFPGIPSYAGTTTLTSTNVSAKSWLASDTPGGAKVFDYQYFANQIPSDTAIYSLPSNTLDQAAIDANVTPSYGYYWYKFDGSLNGLDLNSGSALNIGSKKVILLINSANFNIGGTINLTDGQGFFMVIAGKTSNGSKGNITVDPAVGGGGAPNLEGIYSADGAFLSGLGVTQLYIRGSVAAYGGVSLQRDLANDTNPAEFFEYAPDQIMLFPSKLGFRKINWKEVAP